MAQFKTSRMTGSTPASSIDSHVQDLEDAVVFAFGFETSGALTGAIMDTDIDGNIVDILRLAAAPVPASNTGPGIRFRDTTNDTEFMVMAVNTKLNVYENTGSQSSPTWTLLASLDNVTGQWDPGGDFPSAVGVKNIYGSTDHRSPGAAVSWNELAWLVGGVETGLSWSSGARTRLTCTAPGEYLISFNVYMHPGATVGDAFLFAYIAKNGVTSPVGDMKFSTHASTITAVTAGLSVQGQVGVTLAATDYVEVILESGVGSGTYNGTLADGGMHGHMVGRG